MGHGSSVTIIIKQICLRGAFSLKQIILFTSHLSDSHISCNLAFISRYWYGTIVICDYLSVIFLGEIDLNICIHVSWTYEYIKKKEIILGIDVRIIPFSCGYITVYE